MKINTYKSYINSDYRSYLVKEKSIEYSATDKLDNATKIFEVMKNVFHMHELAEEEVYMICLNTKCIPTSFIMISKGTVRCSVVSTREIFIQALLSSAVNIIICHNHPSHDVTPSREDIELTQKLLKASQLLDINLADHIIIGGNNFFSFSEHGML